MQHAPRIDRKRRNHAPTGDGWRCSPQLHQGCGGGVLCRPTYPTSIRLLQCLLVPTSRSLAHEHLSLSHFSPPNQGTWTKIEPEISRCLLDLSVLVPLVFGDFFDLVLWFKHFFWSCATRFQEVVLLLKEWGIKKTRAKFVSWIFSGDVWFDGGCCGVHGERRGNGGGYEQLIVSYTGTMSKNSFYISDLLISHIIRCDVKTTLKTVL